MRKRALFISPQNLYKLKKKISHAVGNITALLMYFF